MILVFLIVLFVCMVLSLLSLSFLSEFTFFVIFQGTSIGWQKPYLFALTDFTTHGRGFSDSVCLPSVQINVIEFFPGFVFADLI